MTLSFLWNQKILKYVFDNKFPGMMHITLYFDHNMISEKKRLHKF